MKIGGLKLSDAAYVELLRRIYQRTVRWKRPLIAADWLIAALVILGLVCSSFRPEGVSLDPPLIKFLPGAVAYFLGVLSGTVFVPLVLLLCALPRLLTSSLRTWKLLLDYHDRLQQAGLLPRELAAKMESDPPSGS